MRNFAIWPAACLAAKPRAGRATQKNRQRSCLLGATMLAALVPASAWAQPASTAPAQPSQLHAPVATQPAPAATIPTPMADGLPALQHTWRKSMAKKPLPKAGCFKATYPNPAWQESQCSKAPDKPYPPARGKRPNTVGNGDDFSAQVSGLLTSAEGSFTSVTGVTSDTDPSGQSAFSLQLNTSFFDTSVCPTGSSGCQGWQQFIYSNAGVAFMQYWLLNYGQTCPTGWNTYGGDCWRNSDNAAAVPVQPISNLANLSVTANAAAGGTDSVVFSTGTDIYSASGPDTVVQLAHGWNTAEYNLVGDCCSTESTFNAGSTIVVKTSVDNGTTNAPMCVQEGFTGETNNLTMTPAKPPLPSDPPVCCPYGGSAPAIEFAESNNAKEWAACGASIIVGDPHITTLDGTIYNFQSAGEFVALRGPDGLEVQTRQTPLATATPLSQPPESDTLEWDNGVATCVSMDTAVAARVGTHRVTYEPGFGGTYDAGGLQLRIDGKVTTLDGQGVNLGNGGRVSKSSAGADAIQIEFPDGKVLTAVPGTYDDMKYLDVHFSGLGVVSKNAARGVGGLAGIIPDGSWLPTLPDGKSVGAIPASLHDRFVTLYKTFGNAWRVPANGSLFDYAPGTSSDTFTDENWPTENAKTCEVPGKQAVSPVTREVAQSACRLVTDPGLRSACEFDVTATGHVGVADTYAANDRVHIELRTPVVLRAKP